LRVLVRDRAEPDHRHVDVLGVPQGSDPGEARPRGGDQATA
jgi:hypothetical protein